jgi:hypothetical protein
MGFPFKSTSFVPGRYSTFYRLAAGRFAGGALAARHRLPALYATVFVASGGLAFYGVDVIDLSRRAAGYVDRILKGSKPANLPVVRPTKFELVSRSHGSLSPETKLPDDRPPFSRHLPFARRGARPASAAPTV